KLKRIELRIPRSPDAVIIRCRKIEIWGEGIFQQHIGHQNTISIFSLNIVRFLMQCQGYVFVAQTYSYIQMIKKLTAVIGINRIEIIPVPESVFQYLRSDSVLVRRNMIIVKIQFHSCFKSASS